MHGPPRSRLWLGASLILPLLILAAGLWLEFGALVQAHRSEETSQALVELDLIRDAFQKRKSVLLTVIDQDSIQVNEQDAPVAPFRRRRSEQDIGSAQELSAAARIGLEKEALGQIKEALPFLDLACKEGKDSRPLLARARCLWQLDRQDEAIAVLRAMMKTSHSAERGFLLPASLRAAALAGNLLAQAGRLEEVAEIQEDFYTFRYPVPIEAAESSDRLFSALAPLQGAFPRTRYRCLAEAWRHLEIHSLPRTILAITERTEVVLASGTLLARGNTDYVSVIGRELLSRILNQCIDSAPDRWRIRAMTMDGNGTRDEDALASVELASVDLASVDLASVDLAPLPLQLIASPAFLLTSRLLQILGRGLMALALLSFVLGNLLVWRMLRRELELSRLRSDFIDLISHELRTPLTALSLKAEMLAHGEVRPDKVPSYQRGLKAEVDRLSVLVGEILDFARLEKGRTPIEKRETSTRALLARGLGEARPALRLSRQRVRVDAARDLPLLQVDVDLLARALRNLLENASKYAPTGSEIRLEAERWEEGLRLTVCDQGPGIPKQDRERIFEPFIRGENAAGKPGSGLGLALVRQAVEAHGGQVRVEESTSQGTRFSVILPLGSTTPMGPSKGDAA